MDIGPILHEAMLSPDELPGWSPVADNQLDSSSLFTGVAYAARFTDEASVRLEHEETGAILVQHVGILEDTDASTLERDLDIPLTNCPAGEILHETADEAWAVAPLHVPRLGDGSIAFRLIAALNDAGLLLADNVYMRRGRVASALVHVGPTGANTHASIEPLARLADRKLAVVAEKIT